MGPGDDVMDDGSRPSPFNGRAPAWPPGSHGPAAELWHSTPIKTKDGGASQDASRQPSVLTGFRMDGRAKQWAKRPAPIPGDALPPRSPPDTQFPAADLSGSTVQRQRRELQLLMAELKDRDRELNSMAASHHKQLHAWEQDRRRMLTLEQRCSRLDDELQKRNEVIRVLTRRVWVVETREQEVQRELSAARQQLSKLELNQQDVSRKCEDFEEKNQSLNSTVMALSSQVGSLQVREEELSSMLKLKDKDVTEASGQIVDLTARLRHLETSLTESHSRENKLLRDVEENKRRYRDAKQEVAHLKEELQQQVTHSSAQREETIRLKQELHLLHQDLLLSGEGESWKDELLELSRSKQERTMSELRCLRQVCENQRNDLQLLHLNLESAREALSERSGPGPAHSQVELTCGCPDDQSHSSLRPRTSRTPRETPPAGVNGDLGVFSAHSTDAEDLLSSCSLQQLLQESRRLIGSEHGVLRPHGCGTADPPSPQHHPTPPTHQQAGGTPPKACAPHTACRARGRLHFD